jgi:hypothetical protein
VGWVRRLLSCFWVQRARWRIIFLRRLVLRVPQSLERYTTSPAGVSSIWKDIMDPFKM